MRAMQLHYTSPPLPPPPLAEHYRLTAGGGAPLTLTRNAFFSRLSRSREE